LADRFNAFMSGFLASRDGVRAYSEIPSGRAISSGLDFISFRL
jgi:hypothetical protein